MVSRSRNIDGLTHDQLQAECWRWAWEGTFTRWPHMRRRFFSVPNSAMGFLGRNKAQQLAACGLLAGVWDMPVYDAHGATHWLEFKVGKDRVKVGDSNDAQWKFALAMAPLGNQFFYEIRTLDNFIAIFTAITEQNHQVLNEKRIKVS